MIEVRMGIMPQTFVVVGCGGTGSRLIPLLAQFIKTCAWIVDPIIYLVDDDVVEQKNLLRQNFIMPDVGKPKAEVLATRYSKAYNITIVPMVTRVDGIKSMESEIFPSQNTRVISAGVLSGNIRSAMIISCVDNMEARRNILNSFYSVWMNGGIFLDGGNEDLFGQVMVCNPYLMLSDTFDKLEDINNYFSFPPMLPIVGKHTMIPIDLKFYNDTADQKSERSCADLDQTMAINAMVATTMFSIIQTIVYSRPINFYRLNISMGGIFPELLSIFNLFRLTTPSSEYRKYRDARKLQSLTGNISPSSLKHYLENLSYEYQNFLSSQAKEKAAKEKVIADAEVKLAVPPLPEPTPIDIRMVPPAAARAVRRTLAQPNPL